MKAYETIFCQGHPNIRGRHPTTFEVTKELEISLQGDCIIGVGADKGAADLDPVFSRILRHDAALLSTTLRVGECNVLIHSRGSSLLVLTHLSDLVWRRSCFIDSRTVGIESDFSAATLPRDMMRLLQKGEDLKVEMTAIIPE
jgi:hypothetical protein